MTFKHRLSCRLALMKDALMVGLLAAAACTGDRTALDPAIPAHALASSIGTASDLGVTGVSDTSVTLSFTEVADGSGLPASYDVRFAVAPLSWGSAASVTGGSCATPVAGATVGAKRSCTVLGLAPVTAYQFQLVPFSGILNVSAIFGSVSNVASATTTAKTAPPVSTKLVLGDRVRIIVGTANIRSAPALSGTLLGTQAPGALGTVVDGPVLDATGDRLLRWQVDFDQGADGWTAEDYLGKLAPSATVASVTVSPSPATITAGATLHLAATIKDSAGNTLTGRPTTWASSDTTTAKVSAIGLVSGVARGTATITASSS